MPTPTVNPAQCVIENLENASYDNMKGFLPAAMTEEIFENIKQNLLPRIKKDVGVANAGDVPVGGISVLWNKFIKEEAQASDIEGSRKLPNSSLSISTGINLSRILDRQATGDEVGFIKAFVDMTVKELAPQVQNGSIDLSGYNKQGTDPLMAISPTKIGGNRMSESQSLA